MAKQGNQLRNDQEINYYLEVKVDNYYFGIPVKYVRDVLNPLEIEPVPLAPKLVSGSLNLRGRIVTAIDFKVILGLNATNDVSSHMSVVIEFEDELYSLIIDDVGDVLNLNNKDLQSNPNNLNPQWKELSQGIFTLKDKLLIIVDIEKLLPKKNSMAK
ncbi:MAG: cheW [Rickettsiaceae bacterium]|jgi:purine-binding chemotaxis protein CheW|nr:cheW [Rickettsiaceae bacterium]